jgi:hypothetical protein
MKKTAIALAILLGAPLGAQGRGRNIDGVPPGHRPPAGMCRIWIDGVPPGRQPAPTDCATAVRNRPSNARVIYGDDNPRPGRKGQRTTDSDRPVWDRRGDSRDDPWLRDGTDRATARERIVYGRRRANARLERQQATSSAVGKVRQVLSGKRSRKD